MGQEMNKGYKKYREKNRTNEIGERSILVKKKINKVLPLALSMLLLSSAVPGSALPSGDSQGRIQSVLWNALTVGAEEDSDLDELEFYRNSDRIFVLGETGSIEFLLFDEDEDPYTGGTVSGYLRDPDGELEYVSVSGRLGYFTISGITFDKLGTYTLVIWDEEEENNVGGTIEVVKPVLEIKGSPVLYADNTLEGVFKKPDGTRIARKALKADGTEVGAGEVSFETLYDGSFKLSITPTEYGEIKITYNGHVIHTLEVAPAYTEGDRIGAGTGGNAALSVEISQNGWESASHVILTRDDSVADALAAIPMSKKYGAPILMTASGQLDAKVMGELQRLGAENVYIIGGTGAISAEVQSTLVSAGVSCYRISGADRYETAAQIAGMVGSTKDTVYLAAGHGVADALAAGPFAAAEGIPILLTDGQSLPEVTEQKLRELRASRVVILGGTGVVSKDVENELSADYLVERWGGADRYGTQQVILQNLIEDRGPLYVTTSVESKDGKPYAHALLTGALAAKNQGFMLTVPQNGLPSAVNYALLYNKGYFTSTTVVGDKSVISTSLEKQIHGMLER